MLDFFMEGGWGMWPVLALGLVMMGVAVRYAMDPTAPRLRVVITAGVALTVTMVHATWTDIAAVLFALQDPQRVPDDQLVRILFAGLKECTRPGAMGGAFMMVACVAVVLGAWREVRRSGQSPA